MAAIKLRHEALGPVLDERGRRRFAGAAAEATAPASSFFRPAQANGTRLVPAQAGIEHRLFSFILRNWRGRPLTDYCAIVELIGATTSTTGLTVRCELDENLYPAGIKVSDEEMPELNIPRNGFHGERNYTIKPRPEKTAR